MVAIKQVGLGSPATRRARKVDDRGGWTVGPVAGVARRTWMQRLGFDPSLEGHAVDQRGRGDLLCEEREDVARPEVLSGPTLQLKLGDAAQAFGQGGYATDLAPFAQQERAFNRLELVERNAARELLAQRPQIGAVIGLLRQQLRVRPAGAAI